MPDPSGTGKPTKVLQHNTLWLALGSEEVIRPYGFGRSSGNCFLAPCSGLATDRAPRVRERHPVTC